MKIVLAFVEFALGASSIYITLQATIKRLMYSPAKNENGKRKHIINDSIIYLS
jgi:hypothetical protein